MIESGEVAPSFTLPAVRDGEIGELVFEELVGESVIILAFYPGDFNPACSGAESGLAELDLFTMQKDVTVLAISGDSVYSHRAFAEQYDLRMALLADIEGGVAEQYGVRAPPDRGYQTRRAVCVVDHGGEIQFTWQSEDPADVLDPATIRDAIEGIGDDETAKSRYRVGRAHYMEGRRAFTSAMNAYENREWMMAQTDFTQAAGEFDEASEEFNTAVKFTESETSRGYFERAETKSEALWRAADWLADSASAFASGEGGRAESLRADAEAPLETARELDEPPAMDEFPLDTQTTTEADTNSPLAETEQQAPALDTDIDARADEKDIHTQVDETPTKATADEQTAETGESEADSTGAEAFDDAELEEITAELEAQSESTAVTQPEPGGGNVVPEEIEPENRDETPDAGDESPSSDSEETQTDN